ncbi:hypothetical protein GCK72_003393 [Caenorhabditis remanei]|uniref:Uncharacterized protein n=1 Tax=Caenorhabditis remanei TaxID=31234 RepID=A0A6A5HX60_CAERE|nr:hypothetical protein GCK72_003393 [Caenorhabditis remanei]KAF1771566.1 hypothetical protein GCK72_003393 [Caenorhabditis remanei]
MSSNLVIFLILFVTSGSLAARSRPTITLHKFELPIYSSPNAEDFMEKWIVKNCPDLARKEDVNRMPADLVMTEGDCQRRAFAFSFVACNHGCQDWKTLSTETCGEDRRQLSTYQMKKICCKDQVTPTHHKRSTSPFDF